MKEVLVDKDGNTYDRNLSKFGLDPLTGTDGIYRVITHTDGDDPSRGKLITKSTYGCRSCGHGIDMTLRDLLETKLITPKQ